jgi:hypothetical protein
MPCLAYQVVCSKCHQRLADRIANSEARAILPIVGDLFYLVHVAVAQNAGDAR